MENKDYKFQQKHHDDEITKLRESIASLIAQRNNLCPVFRLPVEVTSTIICLHQQMVVEEDILSVSWIGVTHVCKLWRNISVSLPKLWTRITFDHPKWTEEMLKRSQNLELGIIISPGKGLPLHLEKQLRFIRTYIKGNIARIKEIDIDGLSSRQHRHVLKMLFPPRAYATSTRYAPRLTTLRLTNSSLHRDPMPILNDYFVYAHKLKVLEVTCTSNWDSRLFMNLTHLKVENPKDFQRPTAISFYSALKRMPYLQSLELRGAILPDHPPRDRSATGFGVTSLHTLKNLILIDDATVLHLFLTHASFPNATSILIRCSSPADAHTSITDTLARLPTVYGPLNIPAHGLRLDITKSFAPARNSSVQLDLDVWDSAPSCEALMTDNIVNPFKGDPFLSVGLAWKSTMVPQVQADGKHCVTTLDHFFLAIPPKNLTVLSFTSSEFDMELPAMTHDIFYRIFESQPSLHTVFASGQISHFVLDILCPQIVSAQNTPRGSNANDTPQNDSSALNTQTTVSKTTVLFPNLRTLSITDADFSDSFGNDRLFDCLAARAYAGCRLETLKLSECTGLESDTTDLLRRVVSNFVWQKPFEFERGEEFDYDYISE